MIKFIFILSVFLSSPSWAIEFDPIPHSALAQSLGETSEDQMDLKGLPVLKGLLSCVSDHGDQELKLKKCSEEFFDTSLNAETQNRYVQFFQQPLKFQAPRRCPEKAIQFLPESLQKDATEHLCFQDKQGLSARPLLVSFSVKNKKMKILNIRY